MKSYRKELWFDIPSRRGFKNINPEVDEALQEIWIEDGPILVNASPTPANAMKKALLSRMNAAWILL